MIKPSRLIAALSFVIDPLDGVLDRQSVLDVGREIWRATDGSRYETWSSFAMANDMSPQAAESWWRSFVADHDGPDVIERLAREAGWDGGFDRSFDEPGSVWDEFTMDVPDFVGGYVIRPPRATTGVWALDQELGGGIASGTYTAVGGEGGCGKTALAVCCAYANMRLGAFRPLFYSLEIPRTEVVARMLSLHSAGEGQVPPIRWGELLSAPDGRGDLDLWAMGEDGRAAYVRDYLERHHGDGATESRDPVLDAFDQVVALMQGNMAIRDGVTGVDDVCAEIDQVVAEGVHVLPIIDHVHVLEPPRSSRADSEYERVTAVSHALMACAKRNHVPMLALAEIRNVGEKERDTPRLNWFRGSGHVGYDAGCAVILTRDEGREERHEGRPIVAHVVKNRHGRSDVRVPLTFEGALNRID